MSRAPSHAGLHSTAEVRWFFRGPVPQAVRAWFSGPRPRSRSDRYLPVPSATVGVKFREGSLEIKSLIVDHGIRRWKGAGGRVQTWLKWTVDAAAVSAIERQARRDGAAPLAVRKVRRLRTFSLQRGVREVGLDAAPRPRRGCNVELTEITVGRRRYWTLGFEAFASDRGARLEQLLERAAAHCLGDPARPRHLPGGRSADPFTVAASMSYPEWLVATQRRWGLARSARGGIVRLP